MPAKEKKKLVDEIFALTGQKVDESDPIVVAAMFQSACISKAGEEMAETLGALAERLTVTCDKVKAEGLIAHARNQELISRIPTMIKAVHGPSQRQVATLDDDGDLSRVPGEKRWKARWGNPAMAIACFAVGAACAGAVGFLTGQFSATLTQDAAVGRAFTRALPYLRPDDKARLLAEIERQR